ncbi:inter-alpha-trypsin inhibitor heavy chain H4-like isoform X2 [Rhynchophorus ferrugineus]|uniref:inter-alpha-trypsin inhibitor heavy chain H4-like isoform X2 n=2 Tax=Rhynchophorus ferrugineus TaxID=354439 RepID=UPI003FCDF21A
MEFKVLGINLVFFAVLCSVSARVKREYVVTTERTKESVSENAAEKNAASIPQIYEMLLHTNVSNRYAKTLITSKVKNLNTKAQETTFSIVTPEKAFISGFTMEIDGKTYEAYVKEKEEAKKTYDEAVASGIGAAHVAVSARDSNRFTVSVNIEPQSKATFYLRYEELLVRKTGKYELVLNINPGQPVKNLAVEVNIIESRPLKFVKVPSLRTGNEITKNNEKANPEADILIVNDTTAIVTFKPDVVRQKLLTSILGGKEDDGLSGQFIVQYDVARDPLGGEVLVDGGYFVHFFAPEDLPSLNKQILFVLDTSGSMGGRKIQQLKEAMNSILDELKVEDTFSIVDFNNEVNVWDMQHVNVSYRETPSWRLVAFPEEEQSSQYPKILPDSFPASAENIKKAKEVVEMLRSGGGTDIQKGLEVALKVVNKYFDPKGNQPIIVFLTDGQPTEGTPESITSTITDHNKYKVPIFALSFGSGADKAFLQKISLKNDGFARHIYEAADASLQLRNFYQEISSPLLTNVTFKYVNKVKNVTRTYFPILFNGTELCAAGITDVGFQPTLIEALGRRGPITLEPKVYQSTDSLERLWAYLTVKQLLEARQVAKDKKSITEKALAIALKYSFVTDITSLIVVKPNATSALDLEDASEHPTFMNLNRSFLTSAGSSGYGPYRFGGYTRSGLTGFRRISKVTRISAAALPPTTQAPSWIQKVLSNNETISVNARNYTLGLNEQFGEGNECSNSVDNSTGHCTLIHECPKVHNYLTDLETYKKYFCEQKSYAGVCCPSTP